MKKLLSFILLTAFAATAWAACPAGTKYECHQTYSGKMRCGCYPY